MNESSRKQEEYEVTFGIERTNSFPALNCNVLDAWMNDDQSAKKRRNDFNNNEYDLGHFTSYIAADDVSQHRHQNFFR